MFKSEEWKGVFVCVCTCARACEAGSKIQMKSRAFSAAVKQRMRQIRSDAAGEFEPEQVGTEAEAHYCSKFINEFDVHNISKTWKMWKHTETNYNEYIGILGNAFIDFLAISLISRLAPPVITKLNFWSNICLGPQPEFGPCMCTSGVIPADKL